MPGILIALVAVAVLPVLIAMRETRPKSQGSNCTQ
jgi:hypothetical protein